MPYVWLSLATYSTTTPVIPESLEDVSPLSRGLYAISVRECLRKVHISLFPRLFSACSSFILFLRQIFTPTSVNDGNTVLNHGMAATLLYANRKLTNTLVFLM